MSSDDNRNGIGSSVVDFFFGWIKTPVLIIAVIVIFLILLIMCTFQSCTVLVGAGAASVAGTQSYNSEMSMSASEFTIYSFFKDKGYGDVQIAALLGNLKQEKSDFDPTYDNGHVLGIMQWTGASRTEMINWCNENGYGDSIYTLETQLIYAAVFIPEAWNFPLYGGDHAYPEKYNISYEEWLALTEEDIEAATGAFCANAEKPYYKDKSGNDSRLEESRIPYAIEYLYKIKSGTLGGSAYVSWAIAIAEDDRHGYDQDNRDGNPDYDCSSLVAYALRYAGYDVSVFSTATEDEELKKAGFARLEFDKAQLRAGDILWRSGHTEIYIGNGQTVGAIINEKGTARGGEPGDQTGHEIAIKTLGNNWTYIYRMPNT